MSYFEKIKILSADSPSVDAFGRWRVSAPITLFDSKLLHDTGSLFWASKVTGNASASYNQRSASLYLTVAAQSGSQFIRQTRRRFNYQPAKSQLIIMSSVFGAGVPNVIKRIGYYDENDGVYFEQSGSSFGVGLRSSSTAANVVSTFVTQSVWNLDRMDGTGPSKLSLDVTKAQVYFTDFEWLGAGRVRYGVFMGGNPYYVHEITNINALNGAYMSSPNLPVRYSITNHGNSGTATLTEMCVSVMSEGGKESSGIGVSVNNGVTPISVAPGAERVLLAFRKNPLYKGVWVMPHGLSIATPDANDARWSVWVNPTLSAPLSWQNFNDVNFQFATGSTQTVTGGGTLVSSGYVIGGTTTTAGAVEGSVLEHFQGIGFDVDGNPDIIVLSVQSIGGTNAYFASWDIQIES